MVNDGQRVIFAKGDASVGQDALGSLPRLVQVLIRQASYLGDPATRLLSRFVKLFTLGDGIEYAKVRRRICA